MKRYLIINPFGIGDVLFTTPVIKTIKDNEPDSIIGYWCNDRVKAILENNPQINKVFALSRGDIKKIYRQSKISGIISFFNLLHTIKKEHFDISLDFSLEHRYSLISILAGISRRVGFDYKKRGLFLTEKVSIDGYQGRHVVEYYLDLLKFIDIKPQEARLQLFLSKESKRSAEQLLNISGINANDLTIGIAPGAGASWGKDAIFKHWPAIKFARLADKLIEGFGAKILIFGDEQELPIAKIIVDAMKQGAIDLTGKINLGELGALINKLNVLVCNDGGPLHIAVARGVKTVSMFGPVDDKVYGPYPASDNHIVIKEDIECGPCYKNFRLTGCLNNRRCIEDISVDRVYSAVRSLI